MPASRTGISDNFARAFRDVARKNTEKDKWLGKGKDKDTSVAAPAGTGGDSAFLEQAEALVPGITKGLDLATPEEIKVEDAKVARYLALLQEELGTGTLREPFDFTPMGVGQFDLARASARTPHGGCIVRVDGLTMSRKTPTHPGRVAAYLCDQGWRCKPRRTTSQ